MLGDAGGALVESTSRLITDPVTAGFGWNTVWSNLSNHGLRNFPEEGPELVCFEFSQRQFPFQRVASRWTIKTCILRLKSINERSVNLQRRAMEEPTVAVCALLIFPQLSSSSQWISSDWSNFNSEASTGCRVWSDPQFSLAWRVHVICTLRRYMALQIPV